MAFTTAKLSELPLRSSLPLTSHSPSLNFLFSSPKPSISLLKPFSSLRTEHNGRFNSTKNTRNRKYPYPLEDAQNPKKTPNTNKSRGSSTSWINKWPSPKPSIESSDRKVIHSNGEDRAETRYFDGDRGRSAIERIVLRLRNLGLGSDNEEEEDGELDGGDRMPVTGEEKLGDLLMRDWVRPDSMLLEDETDETVLPWERGEDRGKVEEVKKRTVKAPTLAELTIEDTELRRLRRMGMTLRERVNVPKAGVTQAVLEKIHEKWRKEELVRLKFHESLANDMKTAHELVEVGDFDGSIV